MLLGRLSAWRAGLGGRDLAGLALALEAAAFLGVLSLCVAVRVVALGSTPRTITGDEVQNLQIAYRIFEGSGPGIFGLDWNPSPALGLYPLVWSVQVFGNSIADFRMYSVIFSLLTIVLFYALARESMRPPAALAATALLGTNLWFLNFSRTAWENMSSAFFAVGACWAMTRALKSERHSYAWWAAAGVFLAGGFYGYFSGRLLFSAVALGAGIAVITKQAPLKRTALGLGLAAVVCGALFAPMLPTVHRHWAEFNTRTDTVSVFHHHGLLDRGPWETVGRNVGRNFRGFVLQDGSEMRRGLWARYGPDHHAGLGIVTTQLFWIGALISAVRWRRTYTWWPFFVPLLMVELFTIGTPDLARAIFFAPFYFLFMGTVFEEVLSRVSWPVGRVAAAAAIFVVVVLVARMDVSEYFSWQGKVETQQVRLPGVDRCEFDAYQELARQVAAEGRAVSADEFNPLRQELNCSPVVKQQPTGIFELGDP